MASLYFFWLAWLAVFSLALIAALDNFGPGEFSVILITLPAMMITSIVAFLFTPGWRRTLCGLAYVFVLSVPVLLSMSSRFWNGPGASPYFEVYFLLATWVLLPISAYGTIQYEQVEANEAFAARIASHAILAASIGAALLGIANVLMWPYVLDEKITSDGGFEEHLHSLGLPWKGLLLIGESLLLFTVWILTRKQRPKTLGSSIPSSSLEP